MHPFKRFSSFLLLFWGVLWSNTLLGQNNLNITIGAGLPERYYIGINYEISQWQVGLNAGGKEVIGLSSKSAGLSAAYHFWGKSKWTKQRNWYYSTGLNYLNQEMDEFEYHHFYLNLRLGRTFNLSSRLGLALEAGRLFDLRSTYEYTPIESLSYICGNDSRFSTDRQKLSISSKLIFRL